MTADTPSPSEVPLVELLERVPADARLLYDHSDTFSSVFPVGYYCQEAAKVIRLSSTRSASVDEATVEAVAPDETTALGRLTIFAAETNSYTIRAEQLRPDVKELLAAIAALHGISELLACSVGGGVHFAVEPEFSSIDMLFAKRSQAHAASSLLHGLHPLDEEGCFIHKHPITDERVAELIELGNALRTTRAALNLPEPLVEDR